MTRIVVDKVGAHSVVYTSTGKVFNSYISLRFYNLHAQRSCQSSKLYLNPFHRHFESAMKPPLFC